MFTQLNMRVFMATDARDKYKLSDYFFVRLAATLIALSVLFLIAVSKAGTLQAAALILAVGLYKSIESISDILYGVFQKKENMSRLSKSVILHGLLNLLLMSFFIAAFQSILLGALATAAAWLCLLVLYDFRGVKHLIVPSFAFDRHNSIRLVKECFPLGIVLGLTSLNYCLPVYFIDANLGKGDVGFYSAVAYFLIAGRLISGSMIQSAAPGLASHFSSGQYLHFYRLLKKLVLFGGLLGLSGACLALLLGRFILGLLYGNEFVEYSHLFVWLMLAGGAGYIAQFVGCSLTVQRLFGYMLFSNCLSTLVISVTAPFFVNAYGVSGGAMALLCGNVSLLLTSSYAAWINLQKNIKSNQERFKDLAIDTK
jgi:O-antigen/teichoic acid export membrane protein